MIPDSVATLVSFLLLLAPGIVWQLQRARYVPTVKETTLVEVSRVVIGSLAATGASALLLAWMWVPLYRVAAEVGAGMLDSPAGALPYLGGVVATSLLGCGLVMLLSKYKWRGAPPINPGRQWNHVFVTMLPSVGTPPYLIVELVDDTVWKGSLISFDTDPEDHQRGLTIGPPLHRKRQGELEFVKKDGDGKWRVVILPESQIRSIQVRYPARSTPRLSSAGP